MSKDNHKDEKPAKPKRKLGKLLLPIGVLGAAGAGAAGGIYASNSGMVGGAKAHAEPVDDKPKLVPASKHTAAAASEGGGEHASGGEGGSAGDGGAHPRAAGTQYDAAYYAFQQPFTSNLRDGASFVQVSISVATYYDDRVVEAVKANETALRSTVLMTIADQDVAALATTLGKQALQNQLRDAINTTLKTKTGFGGIDSVYFTQFVIQ